MESQRPPPPLPGGGGAADGRCCSCACPCCSAYPRSVKRKLDDPSYGGGGHDIARVDAETELTALREALAGAQQSVQDMCAELDAERSASESAASEAMSMILRLQREKAEALMEARQFKRFAEEKMAHDQSELADLDDLLFKREEAIQSLSCEVQAYRHRLCSYGIEPDPDPDPDPNDVNAVPFDFNCEYPPLRCETAHPEFDPYVDDDEYDAATDLEKYAFGETPRERCEDIESLEQRISQLETAATPSGNHVVMEKGVLEDQLPRRSSAESYGSDSSTVLVREPELELKDDEFPVTVDRVSEDGGADDASDRVYMIDAVNGVPVAPVCVDGWMSTQGVSPGGDVKDAATGEDEVEGGDIKKLHSRLQALEADRESMKQAMIAMRTEKVQLVLLREIAQQLCKEVKPERRVVKKPSLIASFSIVAVFKWIMSFLFWRRKASGSKYTFGLSKHNAGLLLLLDKSSNFSEWRCLTRARG